MQVFPELRFKSTIAGEAGWKTEADQVTDIHEFISSCVSITHAQNFVTIWQLHGFL